MRVRSTKSFERLVKREAQRVNRETVKGVHEAIQAGQFSNLMNTMQIMVVNSLADAMLLGYAAAQLSLKKGKKLSLEQPLRGYFTEETEAILRPFYEAEAARFSSHLRRDFGNILTNWLRISGREGYTAGQATKLLNFALRAKGYAPKTARNITNVFTTGFYLSFQGTRYAETINNPDVWGYRYVTAADERVRETHAAQHGVTLPKNDPFWQMWWPPNGYNCRCGIEILYEPEEFVQPTRVDPDNGFGGNPFSQFGGFYLPA